MASASRRHRQARAGNASYKDSSDDEEFSILKPRLLEGKDPARRNLALKRVSRSQEREEALQIQRAIDASLSEHNALDSDTHGRRDVDSDGGSHVTRDKTEMECFSSGPSHNATTICDEKKFAKDHLDAIEQITRTTDDEDVESSSQDEDVSDEDDEVDASDYAISDVSEDMGRKRKNTSAKEAIATKDYRVPTVYVKRARSVRTNAKMPSAVESVTNKSASKDKQSKGIVNIMEAASNTNKWQGSKEVLKQGSEMFLYGNVSTESSGICQSKSPMFLHRRIIGLSRRFRPPPLHPYLSHSQQS